MAPRVLLVEDSESLAAVYGSYLESVDIQLLQVDSGREAMIQLMRSPPQVLVLDLKLPDMDGMDILRKVHQEGLPCTVVVITAHGSIDIAVKAMQFGAFDFLVKPFDAKRLTVTVNNALAHNQLQKEVADYRENFKRQTFEGFIGESLAMQGVYKIIESAAPSNATVFVTGESGTGKEVCAESIHRRSPRAGKSFVALNCGAIPRDLMESEIFGHVKGAFTGALSARDGAATQAHEGTLFLDEICEMDLDLQTKLLRFIQTGTFKKVGGNQEEKVDVRFVCATNRDPLAEVAAGRFREDLYYRLHVIPIHLPPLRDRDTDIKLIMDHFLKTYAREDKKAFSRFSQAATRMMMEYEWPGNVRQLQNIVRNIVVLHNAEEVTPEMIPPPVSLGATTEAVKSRVSASQQPEELTSVEPNSAAEADDGQIRPLWLVEKEAIERAIEACGGNIPKAAALLDVSASTIYRKRERWEGT